MTYDEQLVLLYVFTLVSKLDSSVFNKVFHVTVILNHFCTTLILRTADWSDRVVHLVMEWLNRRRFILLGPPIGQFDMNVTQEYIHWYKNIIILYITRSRAVMGHLVHIKILFNYFSTNLFSITF